MVEWWFSILICKMGKSVKTIIEMIKLKEAGMIIMPSCKPYNILYNWAATVMLILLVVQWSPSVRSLYSWLPWYSIWQPNNKWCLWEILIILNFPWVDQSDNKLPYTKPSYWEWLVILCSSKVIGDHWVCDCHWRSLGVWL